MKRSRSIALAFIVLGACTGTDNDAPVAMPTAGAAAEPGTRIVGEVDGLTMDAQSSLGGLAGTYAFVRTLLPTKHTAVQIASVPLTCDSQGWPDATVLAFDLFDNPTLSNSVVREPGTFNTWIPTINADEPTPTDRRSIVAFGAKGSNGTKLSLAQSGSVTVTSLNGSRIAGTLDVTFEEGRLTGSFDAEICDSWARSNSIP
jgi:hypothetical protein